MTRHLFAIEKVKYLLLLLLVTGVSCQRYYMPVSRNASSPSESGKTIAAQPPDKYFILRQGPNRYELKDIVVDQNNMTLTGTVNAVDPSHLLYVNDKDRQYRYRESGNAVLNEVHIYLKDPVTVKLGEKFTFPLDQVQQIEVIEHDGKRTTGSYILGGVGVGLGVVAIAAVIVALTKSSCPFVSSYDGGQYVLEGELFGGALNRRLERPDYLPLKIPLLDGKYQLRIHNELKERQHTNIAELLVIEHPEATMAFADAEGRIHTVSDPRPPASAFLNDRINLGNLLTETDNRFCSFDDTARTSGINELKLAFDREGTGREARLLLRLRNSYWFDYLYGEFMRYTGTDYDRWQKRLQQLPASQMNQWTKEQRIPLRIALQTAGGWKEIAEIKTTGPLACRTIVVPVDLGDVTGKQVTLQLGTGFLFWEIDYAAMDFGPEPAYTLSRLQPKSATDQNGKSVLKELVSDDALYLDQPEIGDQATLVFASERQPQPGNTLSVILHTKGYYEPVREFTGKMNKGQLRKFREPAAMARFSLERFTRIPKEQSILALNME